jgi:hypothetical protein
MANKTSSKKMAPEEKIRAKGFFRLNVVNPDGTIAGDTGWINNQIVNNGYQNFLMYLLAGSAGSLRPSHAAIGTGTVPASNATVLAGELTETAGRLALTTGTSGSKTVVYTFTLNSGVIAAASTIQNVALFSGSTTAGGTMMAGNTYATSSLATNQAVNGTYNIAFA